jgi:palmitoyltransferase ZDHHC13/17
VLPTNLCAITAADTFFFAVTAWASLQLSWTIILLLSQYWQITRQMTTLEVSNLGRYGFMGGRGGASMASQMGHAHNQHAHGDQQEGGGGHAHKHRHGLCGGGFLMQILGFDRFTKGKAADGLARAGSAANPFDLGLVGNCKDFWSAGGELGVEYERLYDVPLEGFAEAKRRREREEAQEDHGVGTRKSTRKSWVMGLGLGRSSRAGYEPVSQV